MQSNWQHKARIAIEAKIVRRVIRDALAAGYLLSVSDGEEVVVRRSRQPRNLFAHMMTTDSDTLILVRHSTAQEIASGDKPFKRVGWVQFVYGNGPDVLSDYTTNLESLLAGANALAAKLDS